MRLFFTSFSLVFLLVSSYIHSFGQITQTALDQSGNPNEPTVCFDQVNDSVVYAASNIDNFYSYDVESRLIQTQKATSVLVVYGDPVLHCSDSDVFLAHLSKTAG